MMLFTLTASLIEPEIPSGAVLAIDESKREIVSGKVCALKFPDGRLCIAKVTTDATARANPAAAISDRA